MDIVYDPATPERADLVSEIGGWRLWFGIWCAVAAVPLAIALVPVAMVIRQRRGVVPTARSPDSERAGARQDTVHWPHVVDVETDGNLYTGEVDGAARVRRFLRYGATG